MVKSLVSKLSTASSNLSLASTFGVGSSHSSSAAEETNYAKHRNDPGRFFGDGVQFKAKLIGILEVGEARGDRMCQEALQDLKMAIRAAGEHKQRITIHVTIDGLRLRDEKTGDSLYHHPVHKISFIAQDMTDSRAFGYIFGSPDSGHRFFGIKTDKAASQVVLAMRDLFQVVFELKKKEIEMARQQIQGKSLHEHASQLASLSALRAGAAGHADLASGGHSLTLSSLCGQDAYSNGTARLGVNLDVAKTSGAAAKEISPESVADLVDLEQELTSLQRGITQMERITPSEPGMHHPSSGGGGVGGGGHPGSLAKSASEDDPFGDSFICVPSYSILPPPPESGRNRHKPQKTPESAAALDAILSPPPAGVRSSPAPGVASQASGVDNDDDSWLHELDQQNDVFDTTNVVAAVLSMAPLAASESTATPTQQLTEMSATAAASLADLDMGGLAGLTGTATATAEEPAIMSLDAFTDLDPLGTGRTRPYVDKKYFFQELKNPPKKLLKELSGAGAVGLGLDTGSLFSTEEETGPGAGAGGASSTTAIATMTTTTAATNITAEPLPSSINATTTLEDRQETANPVLLPRDTDPFSPTRKKSDPDPFQEGDLFAKLDAFEFDAPAPVAVAVAAALPVAPDGARSNAFNGPLQVQLPPEKGEQQMSTVRNRPTVSASSLPNPLGGGGGGGPLDVISSISNKKMPHLFGQARGFSKRGDSSSSEIGSSVNMRRLQESDSLSETEAAPEPPPRPDSAPCSGPPPLPPKKQFSDLVIRPSPAPPTAGRYEYLNSSSSSTRRTLAHSLPDAPPIPLPSRRVGRTDACFPGPGRPRKPHQTDDDYMMPLGPPPPLLPPPNQASSAAASSTARARPQRQQSLGRPQDIYENKAEILAQAVAHEGPAGPALAPDITLTQLLTLGMDDLAVKLNVPATKLSTMTLVQLTSYLSEYLSSSEKTSQSLAAPAAPAPVAPPPATVAASATAPSSAAVFKVSFDQQTSFVASFDDTFGEDEATARVASPPKEAPIFEANFANFNEAPIPAAAAAVGVPSADRYAVFREIIDQELQQQQQETDLMGDLTPPPVDEQEAAPEASSLGLGLEEHTEIPLIDSIGTRTAPPSAPPPPLPKIDTKITEVVAQAKDRYAALRDIILVENLFDKPQPPAQAQAPKAPPEKDLLQDFPEFSDEFNEDQDLRQIMDLPLAEQQHPQDRHGLVDSRGFPAEPSSSALTVDDDDEDEDADAGGESSMDSNEKDGEEPVSGQDQYEKLSTSTQQLDAVVPASLLEEESSSVPLPLRCPKQDHKFLSVLTAPPGGGSGSGSAKDDIEIDELMHRAISNLSLDSRERLSPATSSAAPSRGAQSLGVHTPSQQQFNDVSTSPIPLQKSQSPAALQPSPVPSHLSAVSQLIDTATKQMMSERERERDRDREREKQSWATFDSPKATGKGKARLTLPPPPPPASNTSQQDTAESPCSSDPRDDGWSKQQRRWAKKERHQTSSSSRDLSPWDDETPEYLKRRQQMPHPPVQPQTDRHGYYMRHARRMNSCDEDYDYDAELMARREREQLQQRKFKHGLSRSRDNFDLDSPSWYHHPTHHTWSPQEIEQGVRSSGRSFERSAYERSSYGPPMYADKRGGQQQQQQLRSKYRGERERDRDREREREREYRDYARPSYDFDYENVYEEQRGGRSPMAYKSSGRGGGGGDYLYERERERDRDRDRKSFDRESLESFESATRRRRSFGSGNDVYGSLDSRDEYRGGVDRERDRGERDREQMKTRSLRKPTTTSGKLRISGDIDYEQDSEQDFQQRERASVRSLQRPSQLGADVVLPIGGGGGGGVGGSQRLRKSSGSSPWDGEEPALPGQKSWKRPASAAETERRLAESRRAVALGQTPSDGEKERRFRKKTRARSAKDLASVGGPGPGSGSSSIVNPPPPRYVGGSGRGIRDNYDYMSSHQQQLQKQMQQRKDVDVDDDDVADDDDDDDEDYADDEPPTDEDKFERLNRRRHEMHQRMLESERRQMERHPTLSKLQSTQNRSRGGGGAVAPPGVNSDYGFVDSYEQTPTPTPRSNASSTPAGLMSSGMLGSGGESSAGVGGGGGKFNFDDGFESDFNQSSPPPAPAGTASSCNSTPAGPISGGSVASGGSKSLFRFSNDFSEKGGEKREHFEMDPPATSTPPITQKLRFDDNVKISQFDDAAFEDDFAKASFDFEKEQTSAGGGGATTAAGGSVALTRKQNMRTTKLQQRQELIKKSESVNIFAKKQEDPFEDDEFFKSPDQDQQKDNDGEAAATANNKFQWNENENFAKFDENM
ncbi:protein disabled isoform X2 [Drosophila pseudoobscura]|uniref:Protein disabled isoform X2 n=1 Tax=Drosophila pseudoobscura pseudoobscura TaxID=46245 RepID=A0A6I8W433_DROPS|nr:protein disabled isoform X2 [Drosophila pseudoobscura]